LNPTVSAISGAFVDVPTSGSVSPISVTVEGLGGRTNVKVFVGGNHLTGQEAVVVCPLGSQSPSKSQPCADVNANIIQTAVNGRATITFYAPAGQGKNAPVVVVTYAGGTDIKPSNAGFTITYSLPLPRKVN
jgi:hypothetical protein